MLFLLSVAAHVCVFCLFVVFFCLLLLLFCFCFFVLFCFVFHVCPVRSFIVVFSLTL